MCKFETKHKASQFVSQFASNSVLRWFSASSQSEPLVQIAQWLPARQHDTTTLSRTKPVKVEKAHHCAKLKIWKELKNVEKTIVISNLKRFGPFRSVAQSQLKAKALSQIHQHLGRFYRSRRCLRIQLLEDGSDCFGSGNNLRQLRDFQPQQFQSDLGQHVEGLWWQGD